MEFQELISNHIAGWKAGSAHDIARDMILSLSSFSKVTHNVAQRKVVDLVGPYGFTWVKDIEPPVYYCVSLETVNFSKKIKNQISKATEIISDLCCDTENLVDESVEEALCELHDLIHEITMVRVSVERRQGHDVEQIEERLILATTQELSYFISELNFTA